MLKEAIGCVEAVPPGGTGNGPEHRHMSRRDRDAVASALSVLRVLCCACRDVANLDPVIAYTLFYEMRRMNTGRLRPVFLKDHCPRGLDLINTAAMMPFNSAVANSEGSVFAAGVLQWIERKIIEVETSPIYAKQIGLASAASGWIDVLLPDVPRLVPAPVRFMILNERVVMDTLRSKLGPSEFEAQCIRQCQHQCCRRLFFAGRDPAAADPEGKTAATGKTVCSVHGLAAWPLLGVEGAIRIFERDARRFCSRCCSDQWWRSYRATLPSEGYDSSPCHVESSLRGRKRVFHEYRAAVERNRRFCKAASRTAGGSAMPPTATATATASPVTATDRTMLVNEAVAVLNADTAILYAASLIADSSMLYKRYKAHTGLLPGEEFCWRSKVYHNDDSGGGAGAASSGEVLADLVARAAVAWTRVRCQGNADSEARSSLKLLIVSEEHGESALLREAKALLPNWLQALHNIANTPAAQDWF